MEAARHSEIPTGLYCYGYAFDENAGFRTEEDAFKYINSLPKRESFGMYRKIFPFRRCPHFRHLGNGRVECTHLGYRAVILSAEARRESNQYYWDNPDEERFDKMNSGYLLGDSVKECNLNMEGEDFSFKS
jgi:hypothetical protein